MLVQIIEHHICKRAADSQILEVDDEIAFAFKGGNILLGSVENVIDNYLRIEFLQFLNQIRNILINDIRKVIAGNDIDTQLILFINQK